MKARSFTVFACAALCSGAFADQPRTEPTPFEAFATKPSARVLFKQHVGSIDSSDASLKVTALVVDDVEHPSEEMRGVRFELENNTTRDQVYLADAEIAVVKRELGRMGRLSEVMQKAGNAPYNIEGTQSCWMPKQPLRILCPDYYIGPDHSGLRIRSYGGPLFEFPERKPPELASLIERAIAALEKREQ